MTKNNFISNRSIFSLMFAGTIIWMALASSIFSQEKNHSAIQLNADRAVLNKVSGHLNFSGNVVILFKDFEIKSDLLIAKQSKKSPENKISFIEATGNVYISNNKDIFAKGTILTFDVNRKFIVLKGNVEFKRGDSIVRGNSVSLDLLSENVEFDGNISSYIVN